MDNVIGEWAKLFESAIPFWKAWSLISRFQDDIADNYKNIFWSYQKFLQLAPTYLSQPILPWSFSLMQFTKEIKGSPALEHKIVTEVAGYGSQLGTIMDFLELVSKQLQLDKKKLEGEDLCQYYEFEKLLDKVNKIKAEGK
ncbi:hypothetical protein SBDP1_440025 [Syntrophobacter sp. SbD1]|nr:hypothetical protein SBDP1_440025 [Syntrophobacter sp. SbD1]